MKKIILLIIALIFLSGCGIYNLNGFVIPDDFEFLAVVESLDTPQKIGDYMVDNFSYEEHHIVSLSPYELWLTGLGDCLDTALFGIWVANYHSYVTYQIEIFYGTWNTHYLAVYVEDKYSFTTNRSYYNGFNSFRDIVEFMGYYTPEWKSYKVYDYEMRVIETGKNILRR